MIKTVMMAVIKSKQPKTVIKPFCLRFLYNNVVYSIHKYVTEGWHH